MVVFFIAVLHCLFPISGALIGGRQGLIIGTASGVICSLVFGALVFTIPDLIGVAFGFFIGLGLIDTENQNINIKGTIEAVKDKTVSYASRFLYLMFAILSIGLIAYVIGQYVYDQNFSEEAIKRKAIESTPTETLYNNCYELRDGNACYNFAFKEVKERNAHTKETINALRFSCYLNYKEACYELPYILFREKKYYDSRKYLRITCDESYSSCMSNAFVFKETAKHDVNAKPLAIFAFEQIIRKCDDIEKLKVYRKHLDSLL